MPNPTRTRWIRPPRPPQSFRLVNVRTQLAVAVLLTIAAETVTFGAPVVVFQLAGGDWSAVTSWLNQLSGPGPTPDVPAPLSFAAVTLIAGILIAWLNGTQARMFAAIRFYRWFARVQPEFLAGGKAAAMIQTILRTHGPMHLDDIRVLLNQGGPWGPPTSATGALVAFVLKPGGRPAPWLAPKQPGWPFSVTENRYEPPTDPDPADTDPTSTRDV